MRNTTTTCSRLAMLAIVAIFAGCSSGSSNAASGDDANVTATAGTTIERPPQFVILAFDGSLNLDFWQESRAFAKEAANVKFTYFMSGVYFLANEKRSLYHGPRNAAGASAIGFGGPASSIPLRLDQVIQARAEGHEIASHANGHFDGSPWTADEWTNEFQQFDKLIFHAGETNGIAVPDLGFGPGDIKGFRAPLLGNGPGLYKALAAKGYVYDTSKSNVTNYWPKKINGVWDFPLAQFKIVGSGKNAQSMDFSFYVHQSNGKPEPDRKDEFKKEMLDTYMQYFQGNYFGNRAPVHIGHHFSKWNGGAYWEAMQEFATRVCSQPEVKCITYTDLVAFMEAHQADRDKLQQGQFTPLPRPPGVARANEVAPLRADEAGHGDACDESEPIAE